MWVGANKKLRLFLLLPMFTIVPPVCHCKCQKAALSRVLYWPWNTILGASIGSAVRGWSATRKL